MYFRYLLVVIRTTYEDICIKCSKFLTKHNNNVFSKVFFLEKGIIKHSAVKQVLSIVDYCNICVNILEFNDKPLYMKNDFAWRLSASHRCN